MGAEEQIADDPEAALAAYHAAAPWIRTELIAGAGHSPNVEKPAQTATLVLSFDSVKKPAKRVKAKDDVQGRMQKSEAVRRRP